MARTKSFNESEALKSAMLLFWRKGFAATSLKDLEHVMALNPTSIYNTFGNKRQLFQKALDCYLHNTLSRLFESLLRSKTAKEALHDLLKEVIRLHFDKGHPGGCMVVLSVLENDQHDAKTKKILNSALRQLRRAITLRVEQGQKNGELKPDIDGRIIGNHVTALIAGIIAMAKAGFSRRELEALIHSSPEVLLR